MSTTRRIGYEPSFDVAWRWRDAMGVLAPGSPDFEGANMRGWRAGMAKRGAAPVNVLVVGDSNSVGYWAGSDAARNVQVLAARLAVALGKTAPTGWQPHHSLTNYTLSWTDNGTISDDSLSGLGYGSVTVPGSTGWIEATATCDRFWLAYQKGTGKGNCSVKIDAAAAVNITANTGSLAGGNWWDSGPLSLASHTVRFASTTATASKFEGIMWFNGNGNTSGAQGALSAANSQTGTGIRVFNGAKFGATAGTFAAAAGGGTWWTDGLDRVNPHVVVLAFGTNELNGAVATSTFRSNLVAIATQINTVMAAAGYPDPSYVLVVPHGTGANATDILPYRTAIYEAAALIGGAVIDRYALMGHCDNATADPYGFGSAFDGASGRLHLDDAGHRAAADQMADFLLRAAGI